MNEKIKAPLSMMVGLQELKSKNDKELNGNLNAIAALEERNKELEIEIASLENMMQTLTKYCEFNHEKKDDLSEHIKVRRYIQAIHKKLSPQEMPLYKESNPKFLKDPDEDLGNSLNRIYNMDNPEKGVTKFVVDQVKSMVDEFCSDVVEIKGSSISYHGCKHVPDIPYETMTTSPVGMISNFRDGIIPIFRSELIYDLTFVITKGDGSQVCVTEPFIICELTTINYSGKLIPLALFGQWSAEAMTVSEYCLYLQAYVNSNRS
jgi:hypothetical protein